MTKSSLALSNLRGFAILMVVAFHSCIAYINSQPDAALPFDIAPYGWRANPIVDSARWLGFDLFCAFQYSYLMQLLFFLSGLFVWPGLSRKGGRKFLYDRFLRLGVPFVIGLYVLMPVAYYPVYRVTAVDPSWSVFWSHWIALPFWPSGPMWFLWLLLVFNLAAAGLYWLAPRAGGRALIANAASIDRHEPAHTAARSALWSKFSGELQNIVLALAEVSGAGWITSQCSTTLPFSSRKMSATTSPAELSERPCQWLCRMTWSPSAKTRLILPRASG